MTNSGERSTPSIQNLGFILKYHLPLKKTGSMENGLIPHRDKNAQDEPETF